MLMIWSSLSRNRSAPIPSSCAASVASPPPMRRRNHDWRFDGILKMKIARFRLPEASKPCNRKAVHKAKCDSTSVAQPIFTDDYVRNDRSHAFVRMDTTDRAGLPMSGMAGYTPRMKIPGGSFACGWPHRSSAAPVRLRNGRNRLQSGCLDRSSSPRRVSPHPCSAEK